MLGNIAKRFEWPLVRKATFKCSPFLIRNFNFSILTKLTQFNLSRADKYLVKWKSDSDAETVQYNIEI